MANQLYDANGNPVKKKGGIVKTIILAVVVVGIIAAIFGNKKNEPKKVSGGNSTNQTTTTSKEPEKTNFTVGDKVELNGVNVTLVSVKESEGGQFNKPKDGNIFVLAEFLIENNSDKEIAISSLLSFETYIDGFTTSIDLGAIIEKDSGKLDGKIAPGKKMQGQIGYQAKKDYKELEIALTPSLFGKEIKFIYKK